MRKYVPVPVVAAASIAKKYRKSSVIVLSWDPVHEFTHTTTYGATVNEKHVAARLGEKIAAYIGCDLSRAVKHQDFRVEECDRLRHALKLAKISLRQIKDMDANALLSVGGVVAANALHAVERFEKP